jgi:hypothetical protein
LLASLTWKTFLPVKKHYYCKYMKLLEEVTWLEFKWSRTNDS